MGVVIKLKPLDEAIRMTDASGVSDTIWYTEPVTEAEAKLANNRADELLSVLKTQTGPQVPDKLEQLLLRKPLETIEGKPWTIRQAGISTMFGTKYLYPRKDEKGEEIPDTDKERGEMLNIGLAFMNAPRRGYVALHPEQVELFRRKMEELPVPKVPRAKISEILDVLEEKRNKTEVCTGIDAEDETPPENGSATVEAEVEEAEVS